MPVVSAPVPAYRRAVTACFRFALRAARVLFVLALVALPVPVAAFVAVILKPNRRNLPAEVLRKRG